MSKDPGGDAPTARPLRVLVLVKGLGLGGAESLIVEQARGLAGDDGVELVVAHVRPDKTHFVSALHDAGIEVRAIGRSASGRPWPLALARLLRELRPDVVHSHSPLPAAAARVMVRLGLAGRAAAHVATEHNRWQSHRLPTRLVNALTLPLDSVTWAVSDEARASVRPSRSRRRVQTLHHGVDLARVRRGAETTAGVPLRQPDDVVLVHVANRRPNKAHEVMLDAFDRAARENADLRLWLVGQWLDTPEFTGLVEAMETRDRVEVLGYRDDAPALLAVSDALVLSSDHEGLPVAVMEAFAVGRPVIGTAVGGMGEAVTDGVEGLLVSPRDPGALAGAMVRFATDAPLRTRLAEGSARRAADFDAARAHQIQIDAYRATAGR